MMSPIGQYLAEFRPGGTALFAAPPMDESPADPFAMPSFGADEESAPLLLDSPPDEDPVAPDAPAEDLLLPPPSPSATETGIDALKADHEAELLQARQQWAETEGTRLAALFTQRIDDLEQKLATTLAPLLESFLAKAAQIKVLDQLRETIASLLTGGDQRIITVSGPEDLVDAIRQSYPSQSTIAFETSEEPDVTITMGDTRIRSQLRSWARKLDTALGAQR